MVNPAALEHEPLLQEAMEAAGFHLNLSDPQPGGWISSDGVPVDLMIPDAVSNTGRDRRSPSIPPHDKMAARARRGDWRPRWSVRVPTAKFLEWPTYRPRESSTILRKRHNKRCSLRCSTA